MSKYDVASGISQTCLNQILTDLYNNPIAKTKLFSYSGKENVDGVGEVDISFELKLAPTTILLAPSQAKWNQAINPNKTPIPTSNAFQVSFPDINGSVIIDGASPLAGHGELEIYGVLNIDLNKVSLQMEAVYLDESSFTAWDKVIVNKVLVPKALEMANKLLSGIPIPEIPEFEGISFETPVISIVNQQIVAATILKGNGAPDLSGYTYTGGNGIYIKTNSNPINSVLYQYNGKTENTEDRKGPSGWYAAGKASVTINSLKLDITSNISAVVDIKQATAMGEIGGAGVGITKAILCPVGAAVDAMSNPKNWDKVIASFKITYTPDPIKSVLTLGLSGNKVKISVGTVNSIHIIAQPTWSGSVTGSALAAASSALVDMIPKQLQTLIVNKVITDNLQNMSVYTLPELSKTIEGINVTVIPNDGNLIVSGNYAEEGLTVKIN
ncbi:hypothetical protein [uncultured Algibacter sp.]|uniref:hypothetical protein n=1 Tax=uncultured Algibacter sp. TaxID=298659 RepID=UPI003216FCCA